MRKIALYSAIIFTAVYCSPTRRAAVIGDGKISINLVQVNDVYEIAPLAGGKEGGMARVATIKKKYQHQNPNTLLLMAGDFVSPSVYNSLKYNGKPIRGAQMIAAMNAAGMDIVVFGNHEFDIKESELQDRINESEFEWVASNTFQKRGDKVAPFEKVRDGKTQPFPIYLIKTMTDADGTTAKIGFIGLTLPFNKVDYVSYTDALTVAKQLYASLKDSVDAVVAITHQSMEEDELLAKEIPGLSAIIGGHEHDQQFKKVSKSLYITKAMANAKSAYVTTLSINTKRKKVKAKVVLEPINETVALDNDADLVVRHWERIADSNYSSLGFDAEKIVLDKGEPLDGREISVRHHPTNLTEMIMASIAAACPMADAAILNAGSIRVDDMLSIPVTEYDIIRSLPFGGGMREVDMKGSLLLQVLDQGKKNAGVGGYLLYNNTVRWDAGTNKWLLKDKAIEPAGIYRVAISDFLLTGGETNLGFLTLSNKDIVKTYDDVTTRPPAKADIRKAIIDYLLKN